MNRRQFLRRTAAAALMATPAMQTLALCRDFGVPGDWPVPLIDSVQEYQVQINLRQAAMVDLARWMEITYDESIRKWLI
jgi:hypothetical protein